MKTFVLAAAMLLVGASAQAETFSFNIEGHKVRVSVPRSCAALSCISVSAPSITNKFKSKDEDEETSSAPAKPATAVAPAATAPVTASAPAAAPATTVAAATPAPVAAPAPVTAPATSKVTVLPPPPVETYSTSTTAPTANPAPAEPVAAAPAPTVVASAPAAPAATPAAPAPAVQQADANSPLGLWMSEKKEGQIRIEDCNGNLCGYAVNAKTGANGEKVLINMKPKGDKWTGRIKDTRNGGGTYDSTIALRGSDKLRVQGCAFGGMFCGGETWTRIQ